MIDDETRWTLDRLHQDVNELRAWTSAADARAEALQHEVLVRCGEEGGGGRPATTAATTAATVATTVTSTVPTTDT